MNLGYWLLVIGLVLILLGHLTKRYSINRVKRGSRNRGSRIFVSYHKKDFEVARELKHHLENHSIETIMYDPYNMWPYTFGGIYKALESCSALVYVSPSNVESRDAMLQSISSKYVRIEVDAAQRYLIPIIPYSHE